MDNRVSRSPGGFSLSLLRGSIAHPYVSVSCSVLISFTENNFPEAHIPTAFDNYTSIVYYEGRPITCNLWDTSGQDADSMRPLSYSDTVRLSSACLGVYLFACLLACLFSCLVVYLFVCLLVCLLVCLVICLFGCLFNSILTSSQKVFILFFSISDRKSFERIETKWVPEIIQSGPKDAPYILIGNKIDMRKDPIAAKSKFVTPEEGKAMAKKVGSLCYVECSAKTQEGLEQVFQSAVQAAIAPEKLVPEKELKEMREKKKGSGCKTQ